MTGSIPTQLGSLSNLTSLAVSGNQLTGTIPTELGNLSNLTFLYLHQNQLTGTIPTELADLSNLTEVLTRPIFCTSGSERVVSQPGAVKLVLRQGYRVCVETRFSWLEI